MSDYDDKVRAQYAKELQDNPVFRDIMTGIESGLISMAKDADLGNTDRCKAIIQGFQIQEQFTNYIEATIDAPKVADFNMAQDKKAV